MTGETASAVARLKASVPVLSELEAMDIIHCVSGLSEDCWRAMVECWPELDWLRPEPWIETFVRGEVSCRFWSYDGVAGTMWERT